ncbi:MAG: hypothetical protein ACYTGL_05060 [Planctomycetota bacterium]|jgi:hypothetical protein
MARLLYGNFDFEHELATEHYNRPKRLARLNAELACSLIPLATSGDLICCPPPMADRILDPCSIPGLPDARCIGIDELASSSQPSALVLEPWGWSQAAMDFAQEFDIELPPVDLNAVRNANSRGFSFQLENSSGIAPPGACRLESSRQLITTIAESAACWEQVVDDHRVVLKAEFGMSGRERLTLRGGEALSPSVHGWINRRVEQNGAVYLEPWLDCIAEFSTHWDVQRPIDNTSVGQIRQIGWTQILNSASGQYVGSRVSDASRACFDSVDASLLTQIEQAAKQAATAVAKLGYQGPLGIDSMVYRDAAGQHRVRSLQDINARWSMGRVALALQSHLAASRCLTMLRIPARSSIDFHNNVTVIRLTPDSVNGQPCSEILVAAFSDDADAVQAAEQRLLDQRTS